MKESGFVLLAAWFMGMGWVSAAVWACRFDAARAELRACREGGAPPIAVEFVRVAP